MKQEKTIEDYRRDIKLLKLKYLKIQEEKMQLEETVRKLTSQQGNKGSAAADNNIIANLDKDILKGIDSPSKNSANYMSYDKNVMKEFQQRCKFNLGMPPESLFRAADIEGSGQVTDQQFKSFMQQSRLGMNLQHIQRIIQLSDTNCTGTIKKQQFYECLAAFQINSEENSVTTDKVSKRNFVQKSLFKFVQNLIDKKISPHDCFSTMDSLGDNVISYDDLNSYVAKNCKDMNDTECIGTFNYLDIDKEQRIGRDMFVVEVKKVMRVLAKEKNIDVNDFIDNKSNQPSRPQTNAGAGNSGNNNNNNNKGAEPMDSLAELEFGTNSVPIRISKLGDKEILEVVQKITQTYKIDIQSFLKELVSNLSHPKSGIFLSDFFGIFDKMKIARKIPNELKLKFFKAMDQGANGSIDYDELISFYIERKDSNQPIEFLYSLVARVFQSIQIRPEEALTFLNFTRQTVFDAQKFDIIAEKMFYITNPALRKKLFTELSKQGQIDAEMIIQEIEKELDNYQGLDLLNLSRSSNSMSKLSHGKTFRDLRKSTVLRRQSSSKKLPSLQKLNTQALSFIETDVNEYEAIMKEIYPKFHPEKDFFEKVTKNDDGEIIHSRWETIMNDELPTLKKVLEIVKELENKEDKMWCDHEFGPNDKDPYGSKSMYFCDNEVPTGCPPPENVEWLRVQEYLDRFIDNNPEEGKDEDISMPHFLLSGASANDVKQSSYLGDCWFVSALSIIAQRDSYIVGSYDPTKKDVNQDQLMLQMSEGIYPPMFHFLQKYGIYVIKFYKNFDWRYVIIDDRIPCLDGKIIYSHCRTPNEFWVSLIEKAYAKLHNCYQALTSGDIGQGLTDLTGQISMKMRFDAIKTTKSAIEGGEYDKSGVMINGVKYECNEDTYEDVYAKIEKERDQVWDNLRRFVSQGTLMGCSADGGTESAITYNDEKAGIYSGHAYAVLDLFTMDYLPEEKEKHPIESNKHQNHRLLCLRNPWGFGEWLLKWSETEENGILERYLPKVKGYFDKKLEDAKKNKTDLPDPYLPGTDDGMFLMCFKDWRSIFSNLFLSFRFDPNNWIGYEVEDKWSKGYCSGSVKKGEPSITNFAQKNPQFVFNLKTQKQGVKAFINLVQDDGRLYDGAKYPYENIQQSLLLTLFVLEKGKTKLDKFDQKQMILSSGKFNLRREVDFGKLIDVEFGKTYCIVPCTMKGEVEGEDFKDIDFSINFYFSGCADADMDFKKANGPGDIKKELVSVQAVDPKMAKHSEKIKNFLVQSVQSVIKDD